MINDRIENYKKLEEMRNSKLLVYVTSDRQNAETNIGADILAPIANHLDTIGDVEKIKTGFGQKIIPEFFSLFSKKQDK